MANTYIAFQLIRHSSHVCDFQQSIMCVCVWGGGGGIKHRYRRR
jgi:hypothetical protein